ncbi:MAG TPA: zinc-binding dehydrogenase [Steroidobacteraceae bacterium]|nr:zinc-binding dehydrogenase [Steroidobacteraceae bacterium]
MKAVFLDDYGSVDNFRVGEATKPTPGAGEVLIKVHYAGLRWGDIMQRNGLPRRMRTPPYVPGQEASGVVESVGPGVTTLKPGMRVAAFPLDGAYAEYLAVAQDRVSAVPEHVPLDRVLAYPVNLRTAYFLVYVWGKVQPGESVLLHAAAGGVGLLALQIMKRKLKDVNVIALAGSDEKIALCKANGADHAINYKKENYVEAVNRVVGEKPKGLNIGPPVGGVHVALNGVSGPTLATDLAVIRKRGRWVIYGYAGGRATIDTSGYGYDGIAIMPFSSLAWAGTPEYEASNVFVKKWLATEELIAPTVHTLDEVKEVQRAMEQGQTIGKVVFKI